MYFSKEKGVCWINQCLYGTLLVVEDLKSMVNFILGCNIHVPIRSFGI